MVSSFVIPEDSGVESRHDHLGLLLLLLFLLQLDSLDSILLVLVEGDLQGLL